MPFLTANSSSGLTQWLRRGHAVGDISQPHNVDTTGFAALALVRGYPLGHSNAATPTDSEHLNHNADYSEADINDLMYYSRLSDHKTIAAATPYEFKAIWWNDPASSIYIHWTQNESPLDMVDDQTASSIVKILDSSGANWEGAGLPTDGFYGLRLTNTGDVNGRQFYLSSSLLYMGIEGGTASGSATDYQTGYSRDENELVSKRVRDFNVTAVPSLAEYYGNFALYGKI